MKVIRDAAWRRFLEVPEAEGFSAARVKARRDEPLRPGGRAEVSMFERVEDGRPHPRMRFRMPPATDPTPPSGLFPAVAPPADRAAAQAVLEAALKAATPRFALDLPQGAAAGPSPRYLRNSVRCQRTATFFAEARAALAAWALPPDDARALGAWLAVAEDGAYATALAFDDEDTGTYHSFKHDAAFVHFIEAMIEALPAEDSAGFAALPDAQQAAVRRQRDQARNHLDALMRRKYAYHGIEETDIERSAGGFLIDRETRRIVSEAPESRDALVPTYELLRVDPGSAHPEAGAWLYRAGDALRHQDHRPFEGEAPLRRVPVAAERLTLRRAPGSEHLRADVRLDWDDNGYVQPEPTGWVGWAGHCDIKAIMEQLGVTLMDQAPLVEWRSDTDTETRYDRDLQLEMVAAAMEFGSQYRLADGSGRLTRGVHRFGGFRNDSLPDRIQFTGTTPGQGFRFPLTRRKETFTVDVLQEADGTAVDPGQAFLRYRADGEALTIEPNPRFVKTVEQDYNVINIAGMRVEATVLIDAIDPQTGYPTRRSESVALDLRPNAGPGRDLLGTWLQDPARRRLFRVYWDRGAHAIVGELFEHALVDGAWTEVPRPEETVALPIARPLEVTLSREMKRDDPAAFQTLLQQAMRTGQNINADTDMEAPVWNGTVTRLEAARLARSAETGVERWDVHIEARFGQARLEYLMRRDAGGAPVEFAPLPSSSRWESWPDFLWQDFPDVGSKGRHGSDWIVNEKMVQRGVVALRRDPSVGGGLYVEDDYIKDLYELIYCALAGRRWTIVHANKRYGFTDAAEWAEAKASLQAARAALRYEHQRIDLNTAEASHLDGLPGIGPVLAERILALRARLGRLSVVEDLMHVRGVGASMLDRLRSYVRVG